MLLLIYDKEDAATAKVNVFRQIIKEEGCPIGQSGSNREGAEKRKGCPQTSLQTDRVAIYTFQVLGRWRFTLMTADATEGGSGSSIISRSVIWSSRSSSG